MSKIISHIDNDNLSFIRENVNKFMQRASLEYATTEGKLLDIAPQEHQGSKPFFSSNISINTFDIDPLANCTYTGDICKKNEEIDDEYFDYVVCTEVLEHTLQPFDAANEIFRILKRGGYCFLTTPFNFRIHGPLPDCWRFTEHGLRALFQSFEIIELNEHESPDRFLMPIQYSMVIKKPL